jgi:hypothetical protein
MEEAKEYGKEERRDYEAYLADNEFGDMCRRSYNQVDRDENLESLLAEA